MSTRFLELSLTTPDILESLHFYRTLGFTELSTGEVWPHKYAVVTDGSLVIGLHERELEGPVVTLVQPSLRQYVLSLQDAGTEFETVKLGEDEFNLALMRDPGGLAVMLVEARTYSPAPEPPSAGALGELQELLLPVVDVVASARFWAPLTPHLSAHRETPDVRFRFSADGIAIGLGETPRLRSPLLVYRTEDVTGLQSVLARLGVRPTAGPDLGAAAHGLIRTPEAADILLLESDYW